MTVLFRVDLDDEVDKIDDIQLFSFVTVDFLGHVFSKKKRYNRVDKTTRDNKRRVVTIKNCCFVRSLRKLRDR